MIIVFSELMVMTKFDHLLASDFFPVNKELQTTNFSCQLTAEIYLLVTMLV